jgi:hypothetical protein
VIHFEANCGLSRIESEVFANCSSLRFITIPSGIRILGDSSFEWCHSLILEFEAKSELFCLGRRVVFDGFVESLCIPSFVETLYESTFANADIGDLRVAEGNRHFRVSDGLLLTLDGRFLIHSFNKDEVLTISREVAVVCREAFQGSWNSAIAFESESKLRRIEAGAFLGSCIRSLFIPSWVDTIDRPARHHCDIEEIRIADENRHFRVCGGFLLSFDGRHLIWGFRREKTVRIGRDIEVIGKEAFEGHATLQTVEFENDSHLRRIEVRAFSGCPALRSICLPPSVETFGASAYTTRWDQKIVVREGNRHLRVSNSFLLSFDGKSLIWSFGRGTVARIPSEVEVICREAFRQDSDVEFASDSKLRRIEDRAFAGCHSIGPIPASVDFIAGSAFANCQLTKFQIAKGNRHFRVSRSCILSFDGKRLVRWSGADSIVQIPREIEVIGEQAFSRDLGVDEIDFENGSRLRRIEGLAFANCACLRSLFIPSFVDSIDGSAFAHSEIRDIRVADDNRHFRVLGDFLVDVSGTSVIRYFGLRSVIRIEKTIEVISVGSFESCDRIRSIEFETGSKLRCIGSRAFRKCPMLFSISIPGSTETLCDLSFEKCSNLRDVRIEDDSKLNRIEATSFGGCSSLTTLLAPKSMEGSTVDLSVAGRFAVKWY